MYSEYFGFTEKPFSIAPDPRYLYLSERHREALAHLLYGINGNGGFVLLTGEVGTGKTTICRCLLEQIPENSDIALIINPKLSVEELLATICDEFGVSYPEHNTSIKVFVDLINKYLLDALSNGHNAVLIIDEAQNISADVLEQLRLLTNLETSQRKLLQIILLGQPELKEKLSQPELRQLAQRITARYHLGPLSKKEVAAYVSHRLAVAGVQRQLFPSSTINKLYRKSRGVPRLINLLCDRALLGAYVEGHDLVNNHTLVRAAREVFGDSKAREPGYRRTFSWWVFAGLILTFFGVAIAITYNNQDKKESMPVKVKTATHQELVPLRWPRNLPVELSKEMAYQNLFNHWDISYNSQINVTACQQAQDHGMRCLSARGSLNNLRKLNRPAVLKLFDEQGQEFYASLVALKEQTATFIVGTETKEVNVKDIAFRWFGDYTLLWRMPPEYRGNIHPGKKGAGVQWLDQRLALIQGREAEMGKNLTFNDELVLQVKEFQLAEGLVPDGIVGPQTLIHLNTAVGRGVPLLIASKEDN
jgi:general secretion pathway protein A